MSAVHTSFRADAHEYTRSKTPWILGEYKSKLIHYLSGGGLSTFGRTVGQEEARDRHFKFLMKAALFGIVWLLLYIF